MKTAFQLTTSSVLSLALMALALFWPAGTLRYWQAWVFFGTFVALSLGYLVYAGLTSPEVLRRRTPNVVILPGAVVAVSVRPFVYTAAIATIAEPLARISLSWRR